MKNSRYEYIDKVIDNCVKAKESKPIREFIIKTLKDLEQLKSVKKAVYIIEELNGDKEKTFNAFVEYKDKNERKCPKVNKASNILYVGSSTTNIRNRLKQHIQKASNGTYALHMDFWFSGDYKITILEYDEPIEIIQIIEDNISYNLKPAFGKMGGNNK